MSTPAKRALDFDSKKDDHKKGNVSEIIKEVEITPVEEKSDREADDLSSKQKADVSFKPIKLTKILRFIF